LKTVNRTDEKLLRKLIEDLAQGLRAKDSHRVLSHYAPERVQFLLAPPLQYAGATAMDAKGLEEWFSTFQGPLGYEVCDLKLAASADVAFCHSLNRMSGTKVDGEKVDLWVRWSAGLRKIGSEWKITHEHESVPFYMDGSYRAAVDLKP
jgi:ketosteroid isomerase-like protein